MTRLPRRTRLHALVAGLLAAGTLLAACGDRSPQAGPSESSSPTATAEPEEQLPDTWPLTGLPNPDRKFPQRPVLVVKFDNTGASRPQVGVDRGDIVVEELVEGGMTRLAVFFYSDLPQRIGPVRSLRATDISFVKPTGGTLVASGAAAPTFRRLKAAQVDYHADPDNERSPKLGFVREPGRQQPYNLFAVMPRVLKYVPTEKAEIPQPYFEFGESQEYAAGRKVRELAATFSGGSTTRWAWQGRRWVNTNANAVPAFKPDTVVVLRVKEGDAGYTDPAGNKVPETILRGGGMAYIFSGGRMVKAWWSKRGDSGHLRFRTKRGALTIPPGKTWIELVPRGSDGGRVSVN